MIAPDRRIVRRLRARVRDRIRSSAALRAERRRVAPRRTLPPAWVRGLCSLVALVVFAAALQGSGDLLAFRRLLVLTGLAITCWRAHQLAAMCHHPSQLWVPFMLPITDDAVFAEHLRFVRRASWWVAGEALAVGVLAAGFVGTGPAAWLAAPLFAVSFWTVTHALAAALVWGRPHWPFQVGAVGAWMLGVASIWTRGMPGLQRAFFDPCFEALTVLTPPGWITWAFVDALRGRGWPGLVVLAAGAGAAGWVWWRLQPALRAAFQPERVFGFEDTPVDGVAWEPAEPAAGSSGADTAEPLPPAEEAPPVSAAAVAAVWRRVAEQPAGLSLFQRGYCERWITRCLGMRTRIIVDFLQPTGGPLAYRLAAAAGLVVVIHLWQLRLTFEPDVRGLGVAAVLLAGVVCLPLLGGGWLGFAAVRFEHNQTSLYAFAPLGFWEMSRAVVAVNLLRIAMCSPLFLITVWLTFSRAPLPFLTALDYTARGLGLVAAVQPLWVVLLFSRHTNDSRVRWWLSGLFIALMVGAILVGIPLAVAAMGVEQTSVAFACLAGLFALMLGLLGFYGLGWSRSWFDLIARPRR